MTKKKSPEELEQSKREAAERRAFKAGKVAGNGVKTGGKKAKAEKNGKPKADAKKASKAKAKAKAKATGATKPKAKPAPMAKAEKPPVPQRRVSVKLGNATLSTVLPVAAIEAAEAKSSAAHEWRMPRTVSNTIESTAHRQHLTDRVEAETEAEDALNTARNELSKAHLETTKAPRPRCSDQRRDKQRNEVGRSHEDLDVRLTRDEQLETAESCAHYVASRARLKEAKKDVDTTLANLVKGYDERISTYSRAVETGVLSVPVVTIDLLENGEVWTIRADDGRIITKRKATQDELQPPLFGGGEGPGTSFGPTHGDEDTSDSDEEAAE